MSDPQPVAFPAVVEQLADGLVRRFVSQGCMCEPDAEDEADAAFVCSTCKGAATEIAQALSAAYAAGEAAGAAGERERQANRRFFDLPIAPPTPEVR